MTRYVVGFMFEDDRVALIRKTRPSWQVGRLNGIGGHVEDNEHPIYAMIREFKEETSVETTIEQWHWFATLSGDGFEVSFYSTEGKLASLKTTTDEEVVILPIHEVTVNNAIPNLTWLIPLSKSIPYDAAKSFYIQEVK